MTAARAILSGAPRPAKATQTDATSPPCLVLDIDGVLNPLAPSADPDGLSYADAGGTPNAWRPAVIARINAWITAGVVRPAWCTTWYAAANDTFGPTVGLAGLPWPVLDPAQGSPGSRRLDWWKVLAVADLITTQQSNRLVWLDDDIDDGYHDLLDRLTPIRVWTRRIDQRPGLGLTDPDDVGAWLTGG